MLRGNPLYFLETNPFRFQIVYGERFLGTLFKEQTVSNLAIGPSGQECANCLDTLEEPNAVPENLTWYKHE